MEMSVPTGSHGDAPRRSAKRGEEPRCAETGEEGSAPSRSTPSGSEGHPSPSLASRAKRGAPEGERKEGPLPGRERLDFPHFSGHPECPID